MKKLRYLTVLLAAALLFSGCNIIKVNPERDGEQVVAEVNGEKITKKEVYVYARLDWDTKIESWNLDSVKAQKESALENLIAQMVVLQEAKKEGMYTFTAEEQKAIDEYVSTITKSTYDTALAKYQEAAKTDSSIKPEEKATADVDAYLEENGYTREKLKKEKEDSTAYNKLQKSISDKVTVADADIKTQYDTNVSDQTKTYDATPEQAITDENNGTTIVYYPDGVFRVRHILIPLPDDVKTKINEYRTANTDESKKQADQLRTDELKKIEAKTNEFLTKAKDANKDLTKLNALITESGNEDPGMDSFPDGYLMHKDTKEYMDEFTAAAAALTDVGVPSALVGTDYGYHIIWISKKITKGAAAYDDVKDKIKETVTSTKQYEAWQTAITTWMEQYNPNIKRYKDRLHN